MKLQELLQEAGYAAPQAAQNMEIGGICADSRRVRAGDLFVALRGLREDGTAHLDEAFSRGAAFAVVPHAVLAGKRCLAVEDTRAALARLLDAWYRHPARELELIGITGTNGKTSTAAMLFSILRAAGYSCGLIGTVGCFLNDTPLTAKNADALANMTTPDPAELYALLAEMRDGGAHYVVMEVTSHALAFGKVAPLCFSRAVFTNLTPDHLDFHGDMESYYLEKRKLFDQARCAVISTFSPYGVRLADSIEIPLYEVGARTVCDMETHGAQGVSFSLSENGEKTSFSLPVAGRFSIENGALAAMTARSLGIDGQTIRAALAAFRGVAGRMERIGENPFDVSVFVDYAHTPDALEKLLTTVRGFKSETERVVLLFGCGGDRDRTKRPQMGRIASRLADLVILTSDNCRSEEPAAIIRDILRGMDREKPHVIIEDRRAAIEWAVANARAGDILLLAGKGHENYEIRGSERLPFSEKTIVAAAFAARKEREHRAD